MTQEKGNVHVIFGAGALGMALQRELTSRGVERIRLVSRSGKIAVPDGVGLPDGVDVVCGDASQSTDTIAICKDAAVVYHCAQPGYTNWPKLLPAMTRGILEGAAAAKAKFIYGDNLYMYGPVNKPMTENLPSLAKGKKGLTRAKVAEEVMNAHKAGKVRVAIGRASDFYGPGVLQSALGEGVFDAALKKKSIGVLGNIDLPHTYTYIGDFARGLATLGQEDRALGEIWHIPSAETITTRQMIQLLFDEMGSKGKIMRASRGIVSILALFNPMMKEIKEMLYEFESPFMVDHSKFAKAFDYRTTPHAEAVRQTLNWYKNRSGLH